MLLNLKRIYVHMRSFPQARDITELLLSLTPSALSELRDRGLLAYQLNDVTGALRDLQGQRLGRAAHLGLRYQLVGEADADRFVAGAAAAGIEQQRRLLRPNQAR